MMGLVSAHPGTVSSGRNSTADRAIDVLLLFDLRSPVLSAGEIAERLGMSRSTTYRYLQSLRASALLEEDRGGGGYRLGPRVFELARVARQGLGLSEIALPVMQELCRAVDETVLLTRRSGTRVVCVERVETTHPIRLSYERGQLLPLHAGAPSKVLLAFEDPVTFDVDALGELDRFTDATITDPTALRADLAQIKKQGYALSVGELDTGVRGVAAPIFGPDGIITAGISVGALALQGIDKEPQDTIDAVCRAAQRITNRLVEIGS
jgi:DNA-binding IclR family transcriptional regulator